MENNTLLLITCYIIGFIITLVVSKILHKKSNSIYDYDTVTIAAGCFFWPILVIVLIVFLPLLGVFHFIEWYMDL